LDQTISIAGEKTTEADIQDAILNVLEELDQFTVVDYTATDSDRLIASKYGVGWNNIPFPRLRS
jgi:hypothetical protein